MWSVNFTCSAFKIIRKKRNNFLNKSTQCAAVRIKYSDTILPPQKCSSWSVVSLKDTCKKNYRKIYIRDKIMLNLFFLPLLEIALLQPVYHQLYVYLNSAKFSQLGFVYGIIYLGIIIIILDWWFLIFIKVNQISVLLSCRSISKYTF